MEKQEFNIVNAIVVLAVLSLFFIVEDANIAQMRHSSCEGSAVGTMRNLATAQQTFQSNTKVDQDLDGIGEYGLFSELTGARGCRADNNSSWYW